MIPAPGRIGSCMPAAAGGTVLRLAVAAAGALAVAAALTGCSTTGGARASTVSGWAAQQGIREELLEEVRADPAAPPGVAHCTEAIHGDPERAFANLSAELAKPGQQDRAVLFCHAFAAVATRRYQAAYESATRLVAVDPSDPLTTRLLSFAALRTGRNAEAVDAARRAESMAPNAESAELLGKSLLRSGQGEEALHALRLWADRGGGVEARCWIAGASWRAGMQDAAMIDLDLLASDNPRDPEPLVWKASLLWSAGDRVGAWKASDGAMARAPELPQVIGQRLRMAADAGDTAQAQAMVDRLAVSAPAAAARLAAKFGLKAPSASGPSGKAPAGSGSSGAAAGPNGKGESSGSGSASGAPAATASPRFRRPDGNRAEPGSASGATGSGS